MPWGHRSQNSMHKRDLFAKGIRATEWPLEKGETVAKNRKR